MFECDDPGGGGIHLKSFHARRTGRALLKGAGSAWIRLKGSSLLGVSGDTEEWGECGDAVCLCDSASVAGICYLPADACQRRSLWSKWQR